MATLDRCGQCGKRKEELGTLKLCSGCRQVAFCGKECFVQAWRAGHKAKCQAAKQPRFNYSVPLQPAYGPLIEEQCFMPFLTTVQQLDTLGARLDVMQALVQQARGVYKSKSKNKHKRARARTSADAEKKEEDDESDEEQERTCEFGFAFTFEPSWLEQCAWRGIFPMAIPMGLGGGKSVALMAPKLHVSRCVMLFSAEEAALLGQSQGLHISRNWRRRSSRFYFSVDRAYDQVVALCLEKHGENWLYPQLRHAFAHMWNNRTKYRMKIHSFEVWHFDSEDSVSPQLIAGELGFCVGRTYTSLTGAKRDDKEYDSSGSVQMVCMALMLHHCGITVWDLGMAMPYKLQLGAITISRKEWQALIRRHRDALCALAMPVEVLSAPNAVRSGYVRCRAMLNQLKAPGHMEATSSSS